ncbi:PEP-CTERM sorting domain-containing protein [Luteolibacter soli]|uniref:PEP-CTERM sorting domain-containing protein n=1 Tax=Luteolibacter soli TaxID=3135280 RepID=A0ABU9B4E1_9BACT
MKHKLLAPFLAAAALVAPGITSATTVGLPNGLVATTWDTFTGTNFSNAPSTSSTGQVTGTLTSVMTGGAVFGGGDRLYSGTFVPGQDPFSFNLTAQGTVNQSFDQLSVVLKFTSPDNTAAGALGHFDITLEAAGAAAAAASAQTVITSFLEGANTFFIVKFDWNGLSLAAADTYKFNVTSDIGHVSLDAIQIVPEPTSAALGLLGTAMLVIRRRRK